MPIWDQMTIAVTIRSTGTVSTSTPIEPVLPIPIPTTATRRASSQRGTSPPAPASVMPAVARPTAATTRRRGRTFPAAAALPATIRVAAT